MESLTSKQKLDSTTHGVDCWSWHRGHYQCALNEIRRLTEQGDANADALGSLQRKVFEQHEEIQRLHGAAHEPRALRDELDVTNKLLDARNELLDAIPECPEHGKQCVPHALEWIQKRAAVPPAGDDAAVAAAARVETELELSGLHPEADPSWIADLRTLIAYARASQPPTDTRYEWLKRNISGREWRAMGIVYSEPSKIDALIDERLAATKPAAPPVPCIWRSGCDGKRNCQEAGCCLGSRGERGEPDERSDPQCPHGMPPNFCSACVPDETSEAQRWDAHIEMEMASRLSSGERTTDGPAVVAESPGRNYLTCMCPPTACVKEALNTGVQCKRVVASLQIENLLEQINKLCDENGLDATQWLGPESEDVSQ